MIFFRERLVDRLSMAVFLLEQHALVLPSDTLLGLISCPPDLCIGFPRFSSSPKCLSPRYNSIFTKLVGGGVRSFSDESHSHLGRSYPPLFSRQQTSLGGHVFSSPSSGFCSGLVSFEIDLCCNSSCSHLSGVRTRNPDWQRWSNARTTLI